MTMTREKMRAIQQDRSGALPKNQMWTINRQKLVERAVTCGVEEIKRTLDIMRVTDGAGGARPLSAEERKHAARGIAEVWNNRQALSALSREEDAQVRQQLTLRDWS